MYPSRTFPSLILIFNDIVGVRKRLLLNISFVLKSSKCKQVAGLRVDVDDQVKKKRENIWKIK